jgi:hypothetical protein
MLQLRQIGSVRDNVKTAENTALQVLRSEESASWAITIRKADFHHVKLLNEILRANVPDFVLSMYCMTGKAYIAMENDEPIAAAGVILAQPGLGSAWGMITDRAKQMPFMLHRAVSRALWNIIQDNRLRRVDYIVDPLKPTAVHWARRLGFEYEAKMKAFYPDGRPALLYAWIHPDFRRSDG